jgi:SNF2 family DNA or RNA helicase
LIICVIYFQSGTSAARRCHALQAKDRAHRLGQQKHVLVLVLVCSGTIEDDMLAASRKKRSLDAKAIQARTPSKQ